MMAPGSDASRDSLENELWKWRTVPDEQSRRAAQLLLRLLAHMPKTLIPWQSHVALIAAVPHSGISLVMPAYGSWQTMRAAARKLR